MDELLFGGCVTNPATSGRDLLVPNVMTTATTVPFMSGRFVWGYDDSDASLAAAAETIQAFRDLVESGFFRTLEAHILAVGQALRARPGKAADLGAWADTPLARWRSPPEL